jgi:hypothetical protein
MTGAGRLFSPYRLDGLGGGEAGYTDYPSLDAQIG